MRQRRHIRTQPNRVIDLPPTDSSILPHDNCQLQSDSSLDFCALHLPWKVRRREFIAKARILTSLPPSLANELLKQAETQFRVSNLVGKVVYPLHHPRQTISSRPSIPPKAELGFVVLLTHLCKQYGAMGLLVRAREKLEVFGSGVGDRKAELDALEAKYR